MKKKFIFVLPALLAIASLSGCGGSSNLPSTAYEKVKFAFNGVEKSLMNAKTAKKAYQLERRNRLNVSSEALDTLAGLLTEADSRGDIIEELEYNQPPIIQFQYLKKVFEKVGNGYEFGTKYYDTMTGDVYVDMETGYEDEEHNDKNKYNYTFTLGIDINIDANDLIKADVSFDINLAKGSESYTTQWYVGIELDYDMNNSSPNYTLAMVTENNELELPYYGHFTYEYDYVEVKDSAIKEWRKFCLSSNQRLVKDSAHTSIDSFNNLEYEVDCFAWYKNNDFRKNNEIKDNDKKAFANALFNGLGINSTEINAEAFFNKQGQQNSVINTLYNEFKRILGKDIIYDLVTREKYDIPQEEEKAASIKAMNHDLTGQADNYHIQSTITIEELFNGYIDPTGQKTVIHLYYVNKDGGLMDEITRNDFYGLAFYFKLANNEEAVPAQVDGTLYDAYSALLETGKIAESDLSYDCEIAFVDANQIAGSMKFTYVGDLPNANVDGKFPEDLEKMGVPKYSGSKIGFVYTELENGRKQLVIKYSNANEADDYARSLLKNGFEQSKDFETQEHETLYVKKAEDNAKLYIAFKYDRETDDDFVLTAWIQEASIAAVEAISIVGDFNNWDTVNNVIEFTKVNNITFMLEDAALNADGKFKFVINHEWGTTGGIGFHGVENLLDPNISGELEYFGTDNGPEGNIVVLRNCLATFSAQVIMETGAVHIKLEAVKDNVPVKRYEITADEWDAIENGSMVNPKSNFSCYMTHPVFNGTVETKYFYINNGDIKISTSASYDPSAYIDEYYRLKEYSNPSPRYVHLTNNNPEGTWESETLSVHYKIFYKDCLGLIFDLDFAELTYNETDHCYQCRSKLSYPYDGSSTAAKYTNISYYFENGNLMRADFTYNNDQNYSFSFFDYNKTTFDIPTANGN